MNPTQHSSNCHNCSKVVYATEKIEVNQLLFHKRCFKCAQPDCVFNLNLRNFTLMDNVLYCMKHAPKPTLTVIPDMKQLVHALNAPKKSSEGLHKIILGSGEIPTIHLDGIEMQMALNAPKSFEPVKSNFKGVSTNSLASKSVLALESDN